MLLQRKQQEILVVHLGKEHFCEAVQYFCASEHAALTYLRAVFLLALQRRTDHSQVHPSSLLVSCGLLLPVCNLKDVLDAAAIAVSECVRVL